MSKYSKLEKALYAVRTAAKATQLVQQDLAHVHALDKQDNSPVTVADYAAQAIVCGILKEHFPEVPVVAEEGSAELKKNSALLADVTKLVSAQLGPNVENNDVLEWIDHGNADGYSDIIWTLDPIDGTKGFLRGGQYAIALALVEKGDVTLGLLGCPNMQLNQKNGALFVATKNTKTQVYGLYDSSVERVPAEISTVVSTTQACFCESVEKGHSNQRVTAEIASILGIERDPYRIDSQCKYAAVSRGDADIYLRLPVDEKYREKIWDHAAGKIIVEAAGGEVTDMYGKPLDFSCGKYLDNNKGIVASSAGIHTTVLNAVAQAWKKH